MKKYFLLLIALLTALFSQAQINELGIHIGGSNYIGDVGDETYIMPNDLSYGLIYKWNMNPRVAVRASASYIKIKDDDKNAENTVRNTRGYSFKNAIKELAVGIEFNYYDYSLVKDGWHSTPYLILEAAVYNYNAVAKEVTPGEFEMETKTRFTVPFGIGYKTKLRGNIGIGMELKVRYSFLDDNLDYNNTTIPSLNFGNPNDNDWYVTSGINIVFGFGRKGCYSGTF